MKIVASKPFSNLQCDIADFSSYVKKSKYKYIFVVIDVFSRYGWAEPLTSKEAQEYTKAFEKILNEIKNKYDGKVDALTSDNEFNSTKMNELCKKWGIRQ